MYWMNSHHRRTQGRRRTSEARDRALTGLLLMEALVLFVAAPLAAMGLKAPLYGGGLLLVLLAAAIVIASPSRGARVLSVIGLLILAAGIAVRIEHPSLLTIWLGHAAALMGVVAISLVIGQAVFAPGNVTHHRIQGAIVLYLNLAVAFTSAFRLVLELDPSAFANLPSHGGEATTLNLMLYFSFTTLTSTGFGDMVPVHPLARSLTNLEAVLGQVYLVVLLARLVTLHIEARRDRVP